MNTYILLSIFFAICCLVYGDSKCGDTVSVLPPDPKTECCGIHGVNKILGGPFRFLHQHPWVALIEYVKDGKVKTPCGGALISAKYVVTGAHCVTGVILTSIGKPHRVVLQEYDTSNEGPDCIEIAGDKDCSEGAMRIPIDKTIPHPEYDLKNKKNDIALIKMTYEAPYSDFIRPICLPTTDITKLTDTLYLTKVGWGVIGQDKANPQKQQISLPFVSRDKCQAAYTSTKITLGNGQICAGGETSRDFCKGDAGLPLVYDNGGTNELAGIVSFGPAGCVVNLPTVYTNVYEYNAWIRSNIVD